MSESHVNLKNNRNETLGTVSDPVTVTINGELVLNGNFCPEVFTPSNITVVGSPTFVLPVHDVNGILLGYMPVYHG